MKNSKIYAIYFSATGTSKTSVCSIAEGIMQANAHNTCETTEQSAKQTINNEFITIDMTKEETLQKEYKFDENEIIIIGAPVYAGRVYTGAMQRFSRLKGNRTPCIVTVTYGNRHYDDALLELTDQMKEQGFIPVAAAALIGEHTYGTVQIGRPDADDQEENRKFGGKVAKILQEHEKYEDKELQVPGNHPYREGGQGGRFTPSTLDSCIQCGLCVKNCPENAIADDCKTINSEKCISCFACIKKCPVHAKEMQSEEYKEFAKSITERLKERRENLYLTV